MTPRILTALAAATGALALPAAAQATVYCVDEPTCVGVDTATVAEALDEADGNGQTDVVRIGPGTFSGTNVHHSGPERVTIIGAGKGATVLTSPSGPVLTVSGHADSEVRELTLQLADVSGARGLITDAKARDVRIVHQGTQSDLAGARLLNGATLLGVEIQTGGRGVEGQTGTNAIVRDSRITAGVTGLSVTPDVAMTVERTTLSAGGSAVTVGGGTLNLTNAVLRGSGGNAQAVNALGGSLVGRHVTIAGSGTKAVLANSAGTPTSVALHDTVVAGTYDQTVVCAAQANGAASVGLSYSSYPAAGGKLVAQPGCSLTQGAGNEPDVAPLFAGLGHRPRAISPLVDAGTPNDPVATDLTAFAHVGGRSDIGAYEYLRRAPSVTLTAPAQALAGTAVDLAATGTDPDVLEAGQLTYAWDFGDGQTGTGKTQSHAWTAGGTYTVTATATDPAGETSTASQAVAVADPPAPPTDPGQPPADPAQNPGPDGQDPEGEAPAPAPGDPLQAATDQIAPKLSRLALRRGKVTFRLSEAARVTVKAGRVKRTVHARAGRTTLQLKGVRGGRVRLKVSVVDAAGNRAAASRVVKM